MTDILHRSGRALRTSLYQADHDRGDHDSPHPGLLSAVHLHMNHPISSDCSYQADLTPRGNRSPSGLAACILAPAHSSWARIPRLDSRVNCFRVSLTRSHRTATALSNGCPRPCPAKIPARPPTPRRSTRQHPTGRHRSTGAAGPGFCFFSWAFSGAYRFHSPKWPLRKVRTRSESTTGAVLSVQRFW